MVLCCWKEKLPCRFIVSEKGDVVGIAMTKMMKSLIDRDEANETWIYSLLSCDEARFLLFKT